MKKYISAPLTAVVVAAAASAFVKPADVSAAVLYATEYRANSTAFIARIDTTANTSTMIFDPGVDLDSLFFDPSGRIIFTEQNNGVVGALDLNTNTSTTLASSLPFPADMALDSSQTSFLVINLSSQTLVRVSLSGSTIGSPLHLDGVPLGISYDNGGRLFVNLNGTPYGSVVEQVDPITGAVIARSPNIGTTLDGLTYDSTTGMLFASTRNTLLQIDPNNLANFTFLHPSGGLPLDQADGITSDGLGNLYIALLGNDLLRYDISTNAAFDIAAPIGAAIGFDDMAPLSGSGAAPVSEPTSVALFASGLAGLAFVGRKRRRA